MSNTSTQILDSAESMIRQGGYYGFSFRQIADELSIKSASVHYHFPTKEALCVALTERFIERFLDALGDPVHPDPIAHYAGIFKQALATDGNGCLCATLAGETGKIPEELRQQLCKFSTGNLRWLQRAMQAAHPDWDESKCRQTAMVLFSALEGGITFAAMQKSTEHLDEVVASLTALI